MESRLRGGFETHRVILATRCFFITYLCFYGQRWTVALKSGVMYEEHLCVVPQQVAREGSIPTRLPLTLSCNLPLPFVHRVPTVEGKIARSAIYTCA